MTITVTPHHYQINTDALAEVGTLYRRWAEGVREFRTELNALRRSGIFGLRMPDGPEARRRREVLAPLAQPKRNPYRDLAPENLDAEHEAARQRRRQRQQLGWTPNVPPGAGPDSILAEPLSKAERDATVRRVRAALKRIGGEPGCPSWRDYGGIIAGAAIGLAGFAALLIGRVVL